MSTQTVYFISGANRGIGFGLVTSLSKRSDVLIFATARDPSKADALNALAREKGNIVVVKLESASEEDAKAAYKVVEEKAGKIDVLIANAGISDTYGPAVSQPIQEYQRYFSVNTLGPIVLFQALHQLLYKSTFPKFIVISSTAGSLTVAVPLPAVSYSMSKVAVNYFVVKLHQEEEAHNLVAFPVCPGHVQTDMGNLGAQHFGIEKAPVTVEDSVAGILKLADEATRETHGGKFLSYTGDAVPW
ncbi:hypothetical protein JCM10213_000778 [Rhodosporidiobolus nylandii]